MTSDTEAVLIVVSDPANFQNAHTTDIGKKTLDSMADVEKDYVILSQHEAIINHNAAIHASITAGNVEKKLLKVPSLFSTNHGSSDSSWCNSVESFDQTTENFAERPRSKTLNDDGIQSQSLLSDMRCASDVYLQRDTPDSISPSRQQTFFGFKHLRRTSSVPLPGGHELNQLTSEYRKNQFFSTKSWKKGKTGNKPSNRFSLRRTLSNTLRSSFTHIGREGGFEITFPHKNKKKTAQKYRIVEAKTGRNDGISFEVIGKQGTYLRVKGSMLIPDKDNQDIHFSKDCTFVPLPDMWFPGFYAFESLSKPSYFIRLTEFHELVIDKYVGIKDFKEEASFQLNRRPCATCLQIGVQTWAKLPSGEYCLAKVLFMNDENVKVLLEDDRTEVYSKLDMTQLVPDVLPCPDDITVGTRVIAQWLERHTLYPGVIVAVYSGDNYDVLFDDGDTGRVKIYQIRLVRTYSFSHDHLHMEANVAIRDSANDCNRDQRQPLITKASSDDQNIDKNNHHRSSISAQHTAAPVEVSCNNRNSFGHTPIRLEKMNNVIIAPWEIETFSQDSGYHGYDKGNNQKITAKEKSLVPFPPFQLTISSPSPRVSSLSHIGNHSHEAQDNHCVGCTYNKENIFIPSPSVVFTETSLPKFSNLKTSKKEFSINSNNRVKFSLKSSSLPDSLNSPMAFKHDVRTSNQDSPANQTQLTSPLWTNPLKIPLYAQLIISPQTTRSRMENYLVQPHITSNNNVDKMSSFMPDSAKHNISMNDVSKICAQSEEVEDFDNISLNSLKVVALLNLNHSSTQVINENFTNLPSTSIDNNNNASRYEHDNSGVTPLLNCEQRSRVDINRTNRDYRRRLDITQLRAIDERMDLLTQENCM